MKPNKEVIKTQISNQLKLHWFWLKKLEDKDIIVFINWTIDTWWNGEPKIKARTLRENISIK